MPTPWMLVTGNGAFGETAEREELRYEQNPSGAIARIMDGESIGGYEIVGRVLHWEQHPAEILDPLLAERDDAPSAVLSLGVFSGRSTISVERVAVNVRDFQFADAGGARPSGSPVFEEGPAAYLATIPIKAVATAIRAAGVPSLVSNSASTHGCNSVMYTFLHRLSGTATRAGFLHIPDSPQHVAALGTSSPSMDLSLVEKAVRAALAAIIANPRADLDLPANEWEW